MMLNRCITLLCNSSCFDLLPPTYIFQCLYTGSLLSFSKFFSRIISPLCRSSHLLSILPPSCFESPIRFVCPRYIYSAFNPPSVFLLESHACNRTRTVVELPKGLVRTPALSSYIHLDTVPCWCSCCFVSSHLTVYLS